MKLTSFFLGLFHPIAGIRVDWHHEPGWGVAWLRWITGAKLRTFCLMSKGWGLSHGSSLCCRMVGTAFRCIMPHPCIVKQKWFGKMTYQPVKYINSE